MIQRIQTIYLFIAILAFLGIAYLTLQVDLEGVAAQGKIAHYAVYGLIALGILFMKFAVFSFINRKRQLLMAKLSLGSSILLMLACIVPFSRNPAENYLPLLLGVVATVCTYLAYKAIKKDDDLVKSLDRIR